MPITRTWTFDSSRLPPAWLFRLAGSAVALTFLAVLTILILPALVVGGVILLIGGVLVWLFRTVTTLLGTPPDPRRNVRVVIREIDTNR